MNRDEANSRLIASLLDHVREDPYPSRDQLDMIEESITAELAGQYLDVLAEKVAQGRFPSQELLERMQRVAKACPRAPLEQAAPD